MPDDIRLAGHLGENLETIATGQIAGGLWRLFRTLHVYTEARVISDSEQKARAIGENGRYNLNGRTLQARSFSD